MKVRMYFDPPSRCCRYTSSFDFYVKTTRSNKKHTNWNCGERKRKLHFVLTMDCSCRRHPKRRWQLQLLWSTERCDGVKTFLLERQMHRLTEQFCEPIYSWMEPAVCGASFGKVWHLHVKKNCRYLSWQKLSGISDSEDTRRSRSRSASTNKLCHYVNISAKDEYIHPLFARISDIRLVFVLPDSSTIRMFFI